MLRNSEAPGKVKFSNLSVLCHFRAILGKSGTVSHRMKISELTYLKNLNFCLKNKRNDNINNWDKLKVGWGKAY